MDDFLIELQVKLDEAKSKGNINSDINKLQSQIDKLKVQAEIDPKTISNLANQIEKILNQKITISNVNINQSQAIKTAQQTGQQIGNVINQGVENSVKKTNSVLKSFSELKIGTGNIEAIFNKEGILDVEQSLNKIKQIYSEFGQVKITNKLFDSDGSLQQFRVDIQQVNGELKESRNFMMSLASDGKSFTFPQDMIKGSESFVHHLNEAKNISNATGEELNAQKARLSEQEKYYSRIKSEVNHLYNLEQKLLSADELQTAELEKQIKSTKQRITYNNQQIDKKDLRDNSLDREINDLEVAKQKQLALSNARAQDIANAQIQAQAQKEVNRTLKEQQSLQSQVNKIQLSMSVDGKTTAQIEVLRNNFTKLGLSADEVKNKMSNLDIEVEKLKTLMSNGSDNNAIVAQFEKIQTALTQTQNNLKTVRSEYSLLATEQQRLSMANTIEAWNQKNTAATKQVLNANKEYIASLRDLDTQMTKMQFNQISTGFKQAETSMRALNKLGASFTNQWKQAVTSFSTWLSASTVVMKVISETREAVNELKKVDTYLTEISKTNHSLTSSDLKQIGNNAFSTASNYGKTATDYLSGVQDMSRAGYQNAEAMAELSVAAQGAGDMTADVANKMVIAIDKAYKMGGSVEELTKILDGINWVCDNNAVNMTELSEAMTVVGSTAASLGVDVDELAAVLGTMAATTQQSGSEVSRAFKAILLNIRQVSDEEENIDAEGLTKYEKACNALGVSLKETVNGVLQTRDAMEVLEELSEAYNKLDENDLRRTNLLNSVGGKLRSTQLDALLRHFEDTYKPMLQQFEEGNGTMAAEADKTAKSWEGSLNRLSNTWTDTIGNIANSDAIITIINGLNGLLSIVNNVTKSLDSLGTIGLGAGIFAGVKNIGKYVRVYGFQTIIC